MLQPCAQCNRHIEETETHCPFCAAANAARPRPIALLEGRLSRAAVFATALVAPACVVNDPPPQYPPPPPPNYQQPPPDYQQQPPPPDHQQQPPPDYAQPPPDDRQAPPPNNPPPPVADAAVHVIVRFGNGLPYVGPVELHGASSHTGQTNANGELVLKNLVPGNYTIVVTDPATGGRVQHAIQLQSHAVRRVNLVAPARVTRPYDRTNIPKPYGAPPYRKRVV